jgi:hypothetical protein
LPAPISDHAPCSSWQTPIQIVWLADPEARDEDIYQQNLRTAFEGTDGKPGSPESYLGPGLDLGIHVIAPKFRDLYKESKRDSILKKISGGARITVYIIYLKEKSDDHDYPSTQQFKESIIGLPKEKDKNVEDRIITQIESPAIAYKETQKRQGTDTEVEPALRPMVLAIEALLTALASVKDSDSNNSCISLFLSHAKLDGIGAATAVLSAINTIALNTDLNKFYDAYDINSGDKWKKVLEDGVSNKESVLIAIRSNQYEHRFWCQQEIEWALQNFRPIIVADVRTQTTHPPSLIPLDIAGSYSLSDANAFRILYRAIASALRIARHAEIAQYHFKELDSSQIIILPHHPDLITTQALIKKAEQWMNTNKKFLIIYPDPPMPAPALEVLKNIYIAPNPPVQTHERLDLSEHMTTFNRMFSHDI